VFSFGSIVSANPVCATIRWLLGVTPAIESQRSLDAELGERFIDIRLKLNDPEKAAERAFKNAGALKQMRQKLGEAVGQPVPIYGPRK
jgi:hypothetical protein